MTAWQWSVLNKSIRTRRLWKLWLHRKSSAIHLNLYVSLQKQNKTKNEPHAASHRGFLVLQWHGVFTFCYPWLDLNDVWVSHVCFGHPLPLPPPLSLFASTCTCAYVCACTSLSLQLGKPVRLRHRQRKAQLWPVYQSLITLQLRTDCRGNKGAHCESVFISKHLIFSADHWPPLAPPALTIKHKAGN